jgi:hypothetical protein
MLWYPRLDSLLTFHESRDEQLLAGEYVPLLVYFIFSRCEREMKCRSLLLVRIWKPITPPCLHFISLLWHLPVLSFTSIPFFLFFFSYFLSLFYLFLYYFHSRKDKERLKNKWSELSEEEERKGKTFPSCWINMASLERGEGGGGKNFLGWCLLHCIIITKMLYTHMKYLPLSSKRPSFVASHNLITGKFK